jgi:hypothetical protein
MSASSVQQVRLPPSLKIDSTTTAPTVLTHTDAACDPFSANRGHPSATSKPAAMRMECDMHSRSMTCVSLEIRYLDAGVITPFAS